MSVKLLFPSVLVLTAFSLSPAHGQPTLPGPSNLPEEIGSSPTPAGNGASPLGLTPAPGPQGSVGTGGPADPPEVIASPPTPMGSPTPTSDPAAALNPKIPVPTPSAYGPGMTSDWIQYARPTSCYCPIGGNGPIQLELYTREGIAMSFGNSIVARQLEPGWIIQGGVRSLFFQPDMWSAWVVDLGLMNSFNYTHHPEGIDGSVLVPTSTSAARVNYGTGGIPPLTLHEINRTWANFGLGKQWWLTNPANAAGTRWRWGIDGGGRYGTENVEFHEISHHSMINSGLYCAVHTDLEFPCGCCTFVTGLRAEYAYTWSSLLHEFDADVQDFNILLNFGVRY